MDGLAEETLYASMHPPKKVSPQVQYLASEQHKY